MSTLLPAAIAVMLDEAAARYHVPPALVRAVAWVESRGKSDAVSPAGAMGIMQLMPRTAEGLGVADAFDPAQNIDGGVRFLRDLLRRFDGNTGKALAAYNWGPSRVASGAAWPASVQGYISKVGERVMFEEQALAAATTQPRIAPPEEGSPEPGAPFVSDTEPPWPQPCFPPPHCPSCTCSREVGAGEPEHENVYQLTRFRRVDWGGRGPT